MKIAHHIFIIYMLVLSLAPCGDGGGGIVEIATHLFGIEHQKDSSHDKHSNSCGDDNCTPLCICDCCSMMLDYPEKQVITIRSFHTVPIERLEFVLDMPNSSYIAGIWEPPKFS